MISFDFHDQKWLPQEKKNTASEMVRYKTDRKAKMWKYLCNSIWWNRRQKKTTATYSVRIRSSHGFNATCHRKCHGHTQMEQKKEWEINHQIETMYDHLERHHKKLALRHDWQQSTWFERCLFFALDAFNNTSTT